MNKYSIYQNIKSIVLIISTKLIRPFRTHVLQRIILICKSLDVLFNSNERCLNIESNDAHCMYVSRKLCISEKHD